MVHKCSFYYISQQSYVFLTLFNVSYHILHTEKNSVRIYSYETIAIYRILSIFIMTFILLFTTEKSHGTTAV